MEFQIVHGAPRPEELGELYLDAGWHSALQIEGLAESIRATTRWLRATLPGAGNRVVGVVRLQTDYVFYCAIYDLLVHSGSRRKGIGTALMEAAIAWTQVQGVKQVHLWPVAGLAGFYERFGFEALGADQPLMRIAQHEG